MSKITYELSSEIMNALEDVFPGMSQDQYGRGRSVVQDILDTYEDPEDDRDLEDDRDPEPEDNLDGTYDEEDL